MKRIICCLFLLTGCYYKVPPSTIYDSGSLKVLSACLNKSAALPSADENHFKFSYTVGDGSQPDWTLFSNEVFNIGDTVIFIKKENQPQPTSKHE